MKNIYVYIINFLAAMFCGTSALIVMINLMGVIQALFLLLIFGLSCVMIICMGNKIIHQKDSEYKEKESF